MESLPFAENASEFAHFRILQIVTVSNSLNRRTYKQLIYRDRQDFTFSKNIKLLLYCSIHCQTMNFWRQTLKKSNVQKPLCIATRRIFRENIFYIFEKLNNQCKVDIVFIKSLYLNGKTEFYEIILALLENFFYTFEKFFFF